jgi:glycosyltransferase involved in cell wall biosynthesis
MENANTAVEMVFYHLYKAMAELGLPIVLEDPAERCIEMWHGWDFQPKGGNINILLSTGINYITGLERWREADLIFVSSTFFLEKNADCDKPMYVWHHRGIDPAIFRILRREETPFVFTHAVSPQQHKGTDLLCEAFNLAFSDVPDAFLHIRHPGGNEAPLPDFRERYASGKIKFIPQNYQSRKEAWKLYVGNCYVYPSLLDSVGNTVIEALSTGMPALVSELPIFREYVDDRCVWWLSMTDEQPNHGFGKPSIDEIASKMLYIYYHRAEMKRKGLYGAAFARARFTWKGCIIRELFPVLEQYGYL